MKPTFEIWKDVPGYFGYQVSDLGKVRSQNGVLKSWINRFGYELTGVSNSGKRVTIGVHRLVALAFIPNEHDKPQVNHIDGNKLNNQLTNLEWVTSKENIHHAFASGLKKNPSLGNHPMAKTVLDLSMGIYYDSLVQACIARNITRKGIRSSMSEYGMSKKYQLTYV